MYLQQSKSALTGYSPTPWGSEPPRPNAVRWAQGDSHPQRPVDGGGVEGAQRVPEPCDLQPVPYVKVLQEAGKEPQCES